MIEYTRLRASGVLRTSFGVYSHEEFFPSFLLQSRLLLGVSSIRGNRSLIKRTSTIVNWKLNGKRTSQQRRNLKKKGADSVVSETLGSSARSSVTVTDVTLPPTTPPLTNRRLPLPLPPESSPVASIKVLN